MNKGNRTNLFQATPEPGKQTSLFQRLNYVGITIFCVTAVTVALYMQHYQAALPCPLCIFQRIGFMVCGLLALLASLLPLKWFAPSLIGFAALGGAGVSIRHIQIQRSLATNEPLTCGPGLDFMVQTQSLQEVIASVLAGHGDCTVIDWQIGLLTLPMVALGGFVVILLWAAFIALSHRQHNAPSVDQNSQSHDGPGPQTTGKWISGIRRNSIRGNLRGRQAFDSLFNKYRQRETP